MKPERLDANINKSKLGPIKIVWPNPILNFIFELKKFA